MKCPKCHYLSFEPEARCKNCGYGFSFSEPDLSIKSAQPADVSIADLSFRSSVDVRDVAGELSPAPGGTTAATALLEEPAEAARAHAFWQPISEESVRRAPRPLTKRAPVSSPAPTTELPLFVKGLPRPGSQATSTGAMPAATATVPPLPAATAPGAQPVDLGRTLRVESEPDEPLVSVPAVPRAPLAVRKVSHDEAVARSKAPDHTSRRLGPLDRDLLEDLARIEKAELKGNRPTPTATGTLRRAGAAAIDAAFVGGLGLTVLSATLRWTDLSLDQMTALPAVPMAAFLLLLNAGYLLMFTAAGGQTLGKMALGLRVVDDEASAHAVSLRQAAYRAMLTLPSVLCFGAGFIPALIGDERALHDRLAHTRVVRA